MMATQTITRNEVFQSDADRIRAVQDAARKHGLDAGEGLPIINLSRLHGPEEDRVLFIAELRKILHHHGFFYLVGHGVPQPLIDEMVSATKAFFALPKMRRTKLP